jgi:hypothetical protein
MISFPLSMILIPFAVLAMAIIFFAFIGLRNLARYRAEDGMAFVATFVFLSGAALICLFAYNYLSPIDWTKAIEISLPSIKTGFGSSS